MSFQRFCDHEFELDWAATVAEHGDEASAKLMPRTPGQRRADAFTAIFQAAAAQGVGDSGRGFDIVINLLCDLDQYEQLMLRSIRRP